MSLELLKETVLNSNTNSENLSVLFYLIVFFSETTKTFIHKPYYLLL